MKFIKRHKTFLINTLIYIISFVVIVINYVKDIYIMIFYKLVELDVIKDTLLV